MAKGLMMALAAVVWMGSVGVFAQAGGERPFPVVDEAAKDEEFAAFRQRLLDIVEKHDREALLAVTSPNIQFSFVGAPSAAGFARHWELDSENSPLWPALKQVLSLGGSFQGPDLFVAPYVFSKWPEEFDDDEDRVAIVHANTAVYAAPEPNAAVVKRLEPSIVPAEYDDKIVGKFHRIRLADGKMGYVTFDDARRPVDLRAFFARTQKGWQMVICLDGD